MQQPGILPRDRFKPVVGHVAILDAALPAAAYPFHGDIHTLRHEAYRDVMAAHQAAECWAAEVKLAGSLLSWWDAQQRDGRGMSECPAPTAVGGDAGPLCHDCGLGDSSLRPN